MKDYLIGFKPEYSNIWTFNRPDPRYGINKYPGRCAGQVIKNLLWLYTDEGDMVLDPFGGGGTTLDVCNEWRRKCYISDIKPCRTDIVRRDVVKQGLPDIVSKLLILDPPYTFTKKYNVEPTDLGNMGVDEYYDVMHKICVDSLSRLLPNGRMVLMNRMLKSTWSRRTPSIDLTIELIKIFQEVGYVLEERIINTQYLGGRKYNIGRAKKNGILFGVYRDIIVFFKEGYDPQTEKFEKIRLLGYDAREVFK